MNAVSGDTCPTCGGTREERRELSVSDYVGRIEFCTDTFHDREDG